MHPLLVNDARNNDQQARIGRPMDGLTHKPLDKLQRDKGRQKD
jgi:hypothetical protein